MGDYEDILRVQMKDTSISDLIDDETLKKLNESFEEYSIKPIQIVFSVEKEETVESRLVVAHMTQEHTKEKICTFDVDDSKFLDNFVKSIKGE